MELTPKRVQHSASSLLKLTQINFNAYKGLQDDTPSDREDGKARGREKDYMIFKKGEDLYRESDTQKHCQEKSKGADPYWGVDNRETQIYKGLAFKKYL